MEGAMEGLSKSVKQGLWAVAAILGVGISDAHAVVFDMEGYAPNNQITVEVNRHIQTGDFNLFSAQGNFVDSGAASTIASQAENGTDYFIHFHNSPMLVTRLNGGTFSVHSFDATWWNLELYNAPRFMGHPAYPGTVPPGGLPRYNDTIDVVGTLVTGQQLTTSFTIDDDVSFETFLFSPEWSDLTALAFQNPTVGGNFHGFGLTMGYDNIVLSPSSIPEPAGIAVFLLGLFGLAIAVQRRETTVSSPAKESFPTAFIDSTEPQCRRPL